MLSSVAGLLIVTLLAGQSAAGLPAASGQPPANDQPSAEQPAPNGEPAPNGDRQNGSVTLDPNALPVDLDRIQRALSRPPALKLETNRPVFRVEVFGEMPTIEDLLGPDFLRGPVPYGGMTHSEFLNMVTPKDVQGYAAFTNKEALTVAATAFALKWALRQAVQKYHDSKQEREREAARKEVEEALAALRRARREAGLPDR